MNTMPKHAGTGSRGLRGHK